MATPKSSKRSYSDSESDTETQQSSFPHFIVLESIEDKPMSKLSPFVIEKTLSGLFTPVSVKNLVMAHYLSKSTKTLTQIFYLKSNLLAVSK